MRNRFFVMLGTGLSTLLLFSQVSMATPLPAALSPARVVEQLHSHPAARHNSTIDIAPVMNSTEFTQNLATKFRLTHLLFADGSHRCDAHIRRSYQPYVGKTFSLKQLQTMTEEITRSYHLAGYALITAVLEPKSHAQVATIAIREGYIHAVSIENPLPKIQALLCDYAARIKACHPLTHAVLERYSLLANDLPGVHVKFDVLPLEDKPGAMVLKIVAQIHQIQASLAYDNHGSRWMGPQTYKGSLGINHLLIGGDTTQLRVLMSSNLSELQHYDISYDRGLGCQGTRLQLFAEYTCNEPGFNYADENVEGQSTLFGLAVLHPFLRSLTHNLYVSVGLALSNDKLSRLKANQLKDRARVVTLVGQYDYHNALEGVSLIKASLSQGLDLLSATGQNVVNDSATGVSSFTKFNVYASQVQPLSNHFSGFVAAHGQYGFNRLFVSQRLGFGGDTFGRGYNFSEIVGDSGISSKAELRYDTKPNAIGYKNAQYFIAYEAGVVWNRSVSEKFSRSSATSLGMGVRICYTHYISAELEFDRVLTQPVLSEIIAEKDSYRYRGFFKIAVHT